MKKKQQTTQVRDDQAFLEGINLVTGLKINYNRPVLSESQLNVLCINQKLTKKEKAIKILKKGDILQKWSIFDNLTQYVTKPADFEQFLQIIESYFQDLQSMMDVIADGLTHCLSYFIIHIEAKDIQNFSNMSQKAQKILFRLCFRALTADVNKSLALEDWSILFDQLFLYLKVVNSSQSKQMIDQCLEYINGSFSMNATPERRRIAFQIMKGLLQHSKVVESSAKNKISFFNNDTNSKTRVVICESMGKLLHINPEDQQIRKLLLQYIIDQNNEVKQKTFLILSSICNQKHLEAIMNLLEQDDEVIESSLMEHLQDFFKMFAKLLKKSKKYQNILIRFINVKLKSNDSDKIAKILTAFQIIASTLLVDKQPFTDVFVLQQIDYEDFAIFKSVLQLYNQTKNPQMIKFFDFFIQRNIRSPKVKYQCGQNLTNLKLFISVLSFQSQEECNIYLSVLTKLTEQSKWPQVQFLLETLTKVKILELNYEKICTVLLKLILGCPCYLVEQVSKAILSLILSKRRNLEFFLTIKEKLVSSKAWMHRRNYIILYAEIKSGSSYQFQKIIPLLHYKMIIKEKSFGIKLEFIKQSLKIYESIDPFSDVEKLAIKQTISQLTKDKDQDVEQMAKQALKQLSIIDISSKSIQNNLKRNSEFLVEEQKLRQREALMKKNRTQKQIGRKDSKSKTITYQNRTSLRIPKEPTTNRLINIEKLTRPSTVLGNNRKSGKSEDQKKPQISRYSSGQVKPSSKLSQPNFTKKDSSFKK